MAPIRIGVVGCARILPAHLRGLKAIQAAGVDDWRVTALCARRIEDAAMFRKRGEGPPPRPSVIEHAVSDPLNAPHAYVSDLHADVLPELFTDWREMLRAGDLDAVINLTPVGLHHVVTLDALRAGKHVLVEKPLAISMRAGRLMVDEARARGLSLGVAEVLRYLEGVRHTRWAIDEGYIGSLQMWISGGMGSLDWGPDRIVAKTPWRHRKVEGGGGPAIDGAVHLFDQLRYLCGEIEEISALAPRFESARYTKDELGRVIDEVENGVEDAYFAHLRFANGAVGEVFGGVAGHGEPTGMKDGAALYGAKGVIKGGELVRDGGERASLADLFEREASDAVKERFFPLGLRDGFGLELHDWLRSIRTGRPMEVSGEEGLRDLACSYAVLESATLNRPVKVADVLSGRVAEYQREIDEHYRL